MYENKTTKTVEVVLEGRRVNEWEETERVDLIEVDCMHV
jgi:hypothetical protein